MTTKSSGEPRADLDDDKNSQNGAGTALQSCAFKGVEEDSENNIVKGELAVLRQQSYDLASNAASVLDSKEDWCVKDFDTVVGTYLKIITAKTKIGGGEDEIVHMLRMFSAWEESQSSSANSKEDADESC